MMTTDKHRKHKATYSIHEMEGKNIHLRKASYYGMIDLLWLCLFFFSPLVGTYGFTTNYETTRMKELMVHPLVGTAMAMKDAEGDSIRLSKVFKATHSRSQAIQLIQSGRVSINDIPVDKGVRVIPFQDVIKVDNRVIEGWERLNGFTKEEENIGDATSLFEYVKYWKPQGVTCTTDSTDPCNIIDRLRMDGYQPKQRIYPIGRLDKETTGLILLTSDGRLPNLALSGQHKQPKTYQVTVDRPISDQDLERLRKGVVITTFVQRTKGKKPPLKAPTKPAQRVKRLCNNSFAITIVEGRNRQIRKMCQALDFTVQKLHRTHFMGIALPPLQHQGEWSLLSNAEMSTVKSVLDLACE